MKYLNANYMANFDKDIFQKADPFPFAVFDKLVNEEAYQELINNLPDIKHFTKSVGKERAYGQKSHDRYILEYENPADVPNCWNEFIKELNSKEYQHFLAKMFGTPKFKVRYHWHYAYSGCSVSPHCDGLSKIGSHIFYLNTNDDWKKEWGGETLVLKPKGNITHESNPEFEFFDTAATSGPLGNTSFLFQRTDNAWHGVHALDCPDGKYRKVFILVIDKVSSPGFRGLIKRAAMKVKSIIS